MRFMGSFLGTVGLLVLLTSTSFAQRSEASGEDAHGKASYDSSNVVPYRQMNGTVLHVRGVGNGLYGYAETIDGYTIILNSEGMYVYAEKGKNGSLEQTKVVARNPEDRNEKARKLLEGIPKHLRTTGEAQQERLRKKEWLFKTLPKHED